MNLFLVVVPQHQTREAVLNLVHTMGGRPVNPACCLVESRGDAPSVARQFLTALGAKVVVCRADDFSV